MIDSWDL